MDVHVIFFIGLAALVYMLVFTPALGGIGQNVGMLAVIAVVVFLLARYATFVMGIDIVAQIKSLFSGTPTVDIEISGGAPSVVPEIKLAKQVFNIPDNRHTYNDAKAVCKAYGARLATYKEVETAYERGANWCNVGWSEDQMGLYPTQQSTVDKLKGVEGHEHDCGHVGVNGGYQDNAQMRFGVNCYGYKPKMTPEEEDLMATMTTIPKSAKDVAMEQRVNYWKSRLDSVLVSPFNETTWSRI